MNSLQQLNVFSSQDVSYTLQTDQTITFGPNGGNTTLTRNESSRFVLPKQVAISNVSNVVSDIAVTYSVTVPASVNTIVYEGPYGNISVVPAGSGSWQSYGIKTQNQYDEFFANTYLYLALDATTDFAVNTVLTDNIGNNFYWTTTVDITPIAPYTQPSSYSTLEDESFNITGFSITDLADQAYPGTYTITLGVGPGGTVNPYPTPGNTVTGNIVYANISTTSHTITDTRANINNLLSGNAFVFQPKLDYYGVAEVQYSQTRNVDGSIQANLLTIPVVVSEQGDYVWPASINFEPGIRSNVISSITDTAVGTYTYTANVSVAAGNIVVGNVYHGNVLSLTGTKTQVNANLANLSFSGTQFANTTLAFDLKRDSTQLASVNIPVATWTGSGLIGPTDTATLYNNTTETVGNITSGAVGTTGSNYERGTAAWASGDVNLIGNVYPRSSTAVVKTGTNSISFPNTTLNYAPQLHTTFNNASRGLVSGGTGTLEFWVYPTQSHAGGMLYYGGPESIGFQGFFPNIGFFADGGVYNCLRIGYHYPYPNISNGIGANLIYLPVVLTSALTINTWTHVAVTVAADLRVRVWLNGSESGVTYYKYGTAYPTYARGTSVAEWYGTQLGNALPGGSSSSVGSAGHRWGGFTNYNSSANANMGLLGYLDEVRISNSVRYTSGFTPSTTRHLADANTIAILRSLTTDR